MQSTTQSQPSGLSYEKVLSEDFENEAPAGLLYILGGFFIRGMIHSQRASQT